MENILLHCCCAPCAVACIDSLRAEGLVPSAFWYNPNIHPYQEYVARRDTLAAYAPTIGMPLIVKEEYGLRRFVTNTVAALDNRCDFCYTMRLEEAARFAAEHSFPSFTTSLLISPYQKHERIACIAEEMARKYGVGFAYRDFRPLFREGQQKARELGFYMQKYCGCIFSEEERYAKKIQKDLERNRERGL